MAGIGRDPFELTDDTPVFVISVAAQLAGLHAQTLRQYDRLGLVSPGRTPSGGRRYSARNIEQIRQVQRLSQDEGINLAGVKRILELEDIAAALRQQLRELRHELDHLRAVAEQMSADVSGAAFRRDLAPMSEHARQTALAVWRPRRWRADGAGLVERIDQTEADRLDRIDQADSPDREQQGRPGQSERPERLTRHGGTAAHMSAAHMSKESPGSD